jgi:hypothetical protein
VIDALITTRILVQFIGQIGAITPPRRGAAPVARMWSPSPSLVALAGWLFVFVTSDVRVILFGLGTLVVGGVVFVGWSWRAQCWPFGIAPVSVKDPVK